MLIVDAHEDIAWNIHTFGRDYTRSALWNRCREAGTEIPSYNGSTLLGKSEWLLGHVGVIFASLFVLPAQHDPGGWNVLCYSSPQEAHDLALAQLETYSDLVDRDDRFHLISTRADLEEVLATWGAEKSLVDRRIGLVPLMEGADPILEPEQVEEWHERGVRIVGLAWESTRYAGGTHEPGPLTPAGKHLLEVMVSLNLILDLSHLSEAAYFQALELYEGSVIVSHANPHRFCPAPRGLTDRMIAGLAERDGVMGIVPYNAFLMPGWQKGDRKDAVHVTRVVDAIDHVCQVTGSYRHVGIGTDFDGGFGAEHVPAEIDTIADLHTLQQPLEQRGYSPEQVAAIFAGNWLRMLRAALPE